MALRGGWWLPVALPVALLAGDAGAAPVDKQACVQAHEQAQEARQGGKFREAREHLKLCSNAACPGLARTDCVGWLADLEREQPSLRLVIRDASGASVAGASVSVDGEAAGDGSSAVEVDPGDHTVRITKEGMAPQERSVSVKSGQRGVLVEVTLAPQAASGPTAATEAPKGRSLAAPLVLGGVGVLGLGAFAYFGLTGKADEQDLKKCKPYCAQSDVDATARKYIAADIGLGVGVVAIGAAVYLLLSRPAAQEQPRAAQISPWLGRDGGGAAGIWTF